MVLSKIVSLYLLDFYAEQILDYMDVCPFNTSKMCYLMHEYIKHTVFYK